MAASAGLAVLKLKTAWRDGNTDLTIQPLVLMQRGWLRARTDA